MKANTVRERMIHNEAVFREYNEKVQRGIQQLEQMAQDTTHQISDEFSDHELHFYCECSNENCTDRVIMTTKQYEKIHQNRKAFVVLKGHESETVEKVIKSTDVYSIVEKFVNPSKISKDLTSTLPTPG